VANGLPVMNTGDSTKADNPNHGAFQSLCRRLGETPAITARANPSIYPKVAIDAPAGFKYPGPGMRARMILIPERFDETMTRSGRVSQIDKRGIRTDFSA
jgi:hypothetical protein